MLLLLILLLIFLLLLILLLILLLSLLLPAAPLLNTLFQESDNEMVISDVDTGEFIAKKIIYD